MSWIYGYFYKVKPEQQASPLKAPLKEYHSQLIDIFAGANPQTLYQAVIGQQTLFVLGDPIIVEGEDYRYPEPADWAGIIASEERIWGLDGHFLILVTDGESISCYNDSLCKRTLYFHESKEDIFFSSDQALLKRIRKPEIDYERFGIYWHSMFPSAHRRYAPTQKSYFQGVEMLGSSGKAKISFGQPLTLTHRLWSPAAKQGNLNRMVENMCLLPVKAGKRISIGLSGGMDIRSLLAVYLKVKADVKIVNFGSDQSSDHQIARKIASSNGLPFQYMSFEEAGNSWERAEEFLASRGVTSDPDGSCFLYYYPRVAQDTDVYINGYFGELFRFRYMVAGLKSIFETKTLDYHNLGAYLYSNPRSWFTSDALRIMHHGFWESLRDAARSMPSAKSMMNPLWMNLFLVRYCPRALCIPELAAVDEHVIDHMPYVQSSIISGHWYYGFWRQLNEGLHRSIIRQNCPALESIPLALAEISAPYYYRSYALKLKMRWQYRKTPRMRAQRAEEFLTMHKDRVYGLLDDPSITGDAAISMPLLKDICDRFYSGDTAYQGAVTSFISFALGKK